MMVVYCILETLSFPSNSEQECKVANYYFTPNINEKTVIVYNVKLIMLINLQDNCKDVVLFLIFNSLSQG